MPADQQAWERYKQIVDRPFRKINFASTISFILLTIFFSCGPRSGIHHDNQVDDKNNVSTIDTSSPQYKSELKLSENFDKGHKLFRLYCAVCHAGRSDQRMVGPGFKGIADRLPKPAEEWFIKYTLNNDSVYKSGDKYARKLRADYEGEEMTIFSGELTREQIKSIYSYLTSPPRQRGCVIE